MFAVDYLDHLIQSLRDGMGGCVRAGEKIYFSLLQAPAKPFILPLESLQLALQRFDPGIRVLLVGTAKQLFLQMSEPLLAFLL